VLARVQQDVGERVPHLARRPKYAHVAAIREHGTAAVKHSIRRACQSGAERLEARTKRFGA
jgi:hypothetical protein